ncbi:MAG: putative Ig domain-containing protein, partial [Candidatus Dadabacteria bacterium]|nr:putative Ig domain-containing protein [Candidatus Dadabacteria bacterium]
MNFPVAIQRTLYTLSATDEDGDQATWTFHLTVVDIEPTFDMSLPFDLVLSIGEGFDDRSPGLVPFATRGNGRLAYSLSPSVPAGMRFWRIGGITDLWGTPHTAQGRTTYTVTATDADGDTATYNFYITVEADTIPDFSTAGAIDATFTSGTEITPLQLPEATNVNRPFTYSITSGALPHGLSFNVFTRTISGTPVSGQQRTQLAMTATDKDGDTGDYTFYITIEGPSFGPQEAIEKTLVASTEIIPFQLPEVDAGLGVGVVSPVTYSISSGTPLPPTLTFSQSNRMISGTPTAVQPRTRYTLTATDGNGAKALYDFYITVEGLGFGSTTEIDKIFIANTPIIPFELPVAEGGEGEVTYAITPALPPTLTFNPSNRMIGGTPGAAQPRRRYTLTASDGTNTDTYDFHITIRGLFFDSPPVIDRTLVSNIEINPVLQLPPATGGAGILTYGISPSTPLPPGLRFDGNTLRISGTPTTTQARTPYIMTV